MLQPVIKRLIIKNFKCIKELDIELAPFTIFVGPNGSGKSSILEALALMSQAAKENKSIRNAIRGELVEYQDFREILYKGQESLELTLGFTTDVSVKEVELGLEKDLEEASHYASTVSQEVADFVRKYLDFLRKLKEDVLAKKDFIEATYTYSVSDLREIHTYKIEGYEITFGYDKARRNYISIPKDFKLSFSTSSISEAFLQPFAVAGYESEFSRYLVNALRKKLSKVYLLSAERGSIPWALPAPAEKRAWVGRRGENTLAILAELMKPGYESRWVFYERLCEDFGIERPWAGWEARDIITSQYRDRYLGSVHRLPMLGYGSRQLLPVIIQLAYSDPESVILVEEPEISLHPGYQRMLPVLFGLAVSEGKQVLVTTHSSYFPLSLDLVLSKEGYIIKTYTLEKRSKQAEEKSISIRLEPTDIAVYHVVRDKEGHTRVERLEIDERGLKSGIPSFIDVEREILGRFLYAV
jgi:predicted ATPase